MGGERATKRRVGLAAEERGGAGFARLVAVYEARVVVACARCRRAIPAGDRFTRRKAGAGRGAAPVCRRCAPFSDPS
jgi:hypothetical protein